MHHQLIPKPKEQLHTFEFPNVQAICLCLLLYASTLISKQKKIKVAKGIKAQMRYRFSIGDALTTPALKDSNQNCPLPRAEFC
jgi:hypothetical protein